MIRKNLRRTRDDKIIMRQNHMNATDLIASHSRKLHEFSFTVTIKQLSYGGNEHLFR